MEIETTTRQDHSSHIRTNVTLRVLEIVISITIFITSVGAVLIALLILWTLSIWRPLYRESAE